MAKNPDYTESAINLTNPEKVMALMSELALQQVTLESCQAKADALIPKKLRDEMAESERIIGVITGLVRDKVNEEGSYQDIELGIYAIAQRKVSVTYDPVRAKAAIPDYAKAVIKETVDKTAIKGLLKGKLISQAQVDEFSDEDETTAYIIKNVGPDAVIDDPGIKLGDAGAVVTK